MLKDLWDQIPTWYKIVFAFFTILSIAATIYTFKECGTKAFFLGNGGFYAAISGMCK